MKDTCYLVLTKKKYSSIRVRATAKKPATASNEVAIRLDLDIPDGLFEKPQLQAKIKIDPAKGPAVIDADVIENLADIIKEQTGINVSISVAGVLEDKQTIANRIGS